MTKPGAPSRSSATFSIQAGLLSIPVKLYTATEDAGIKRDQWILREVTDSDGKPAVKAYRVGSRPAIKNDDDSYGDNVERADIVKKFDTSQGLVQLDDDEIERLVVGAKGIADILVTNPYDVFDSGQYVPSGLRWQVRAEKAGEKAYNLLLAGLETSERFAVLRWTNGGTVYVGALFFDGTLVGLRYDEEVREVKPLPKPAFSAEELQLILDLITEVVPFEANAIELVHPAEKVRAYAEEKAAALANNTDAPKLPQHQNVTTTDIVSSLRASLVASAQANKAQREGAKVS